jgi:multidrug efflux pump subunit AcrB
VRKEIQAIPGIELAVGYNRPIWINLLGRRPRGSRRSPPRRSPEMAQIKGITDLESSLKAQNPAIVIKVNNELASDLGLSVQQIGTAVRPFVAGDVISHWLAPDGQNYEVNVQLPQSGRRVTADLGDLHVMSVKRTDDGNPILVPLRQGRGLRALDQPADHQATGPAAARRPLRERRGPAVGRRRQGSRGAHQGLAAPARIPPGTSPGQQQDMQESFNAAVARSAWR